MVAAGWHTPDSLESSTMSMCVSAPEAINNYLCKRNCVNQLYMWYNLPQFLDIALTINKMDGYDLSNRLHHKCMPQEIDDTVLVIQLMGGSCFTSFSYKVSEDICK